MAVDRLKPTPMVTEFIASCKDLLSTPISEVQQPWDNCLCIFAAAKRLKLVKHIYLNYNPVSMYWTLGAVSLMICVWLQHGGAAG